MIGRSYHEIQGWRWKTRPDFLHIFYDQVSV